MNTPAAAAPPIPPASPVPADAAVKPAKAFYRPRFLKVFTGLVYLWLFAPIGIVILFSFNTTKSLQQFQGFSLKWYESFFQDATLKSSLVASLEISLVVMAVATILGTTLALGLVRSRARWSTGVNILMLVPLVTPEIVAAASSLLLFSQLAWPLSLGTIIIAQITFSISYVAVVVRARLTGLNREAEEAAMDLGATRFQALRLVTLPALWPAIIASGLLTFVLAFDDFVISFFTTGESPQPLPVRIYSAIRTGISPTINATGTIMMVVSLAIIILALLLPRFFGRKESGLDVLTAGEVGK